MKPCKGRTWENPELWLGSKNPWNFIGLAAMPEGALSTAD